MKRARGKGQKAERKGAVYTAHSRSLLKEICALLGTGEGCCAWNMARSLRLRTRDVALRVLVGSHFTYLNNIYGTFIGSS